MARKQVLETQAQIIEQIMAKHKIQAKVTGGALLPRKVRFDVSTHVGERIRGIRGLMGEIALALGVKSARLDQTVDGLAIQIPRPDPRTVSLPNILKARSPGPARPVLGLGDNKVPILANLNSPDVAHVLIAGTTGSGKTSLVRSMIISMALWSTTREVAMVLVDPKGTQFNDLSRLPHLATDIITDPQVATQVLEMLVSRLDMDASSDQRVVIVIDEVADLLMTAGRSATHALTRLTQIGRSAGYHIIAATQKPTAAVLGSLIKANFPLRLVGRVTSPEEAKTATGYAGTGAENLPGAGEFIAVSGTDRLAFSAAYATAAQVDTLIQEILIKAGPPIERLIIPPLADPDPLTQQLDLARPAWLAWRDGSGGLQRGGHIAMAQVLFGPRATGAGHQHRTIKAIIAALEVRALRGVYDQPDSTDQARAKAATPQRPLEGCVPGGQRPGVGLASGGSSPPPPLPAALQRSPDTSERPLGGSSDLPTRWIPALLRSNGPKRRAWGR